MSSALVVGGQAEIKCRQCRGGRHGVDAGEPELTLSHVDRSITNRRFAADGQFTQDLARKAVLKVNKLFVIT